MKPKKKAKKPRKRGIDIAAVQGSLRDSVPNVVNNLVFGSEQRAAAIQKGFEVLNAAHQALGELVGMARASGHGNEAAMCAGVVRIALKAMGEQIAEAIS
jgi:hypothetical protein